MNLLNILAFLIFFLIGLAFILPGLYLIISTFKSNKNSYQYDYMGYVVAAAAITVGALAMTIVFIGM